MESVEDPRRVTQLGTTCHLGSTKMITTNSFHPERARRSIGRSRTSYAAHNRTSLYSSSIWRELASSIPQKLSRIESLQRHDATTLHSAPVADPNRTNEQLEERFRELVELTSLDEGSPQSFRARAYDIAITEIRIYKEDLSGLTESQLTKINGIGKSTAKKIREFFETGTIQKLEDLRAKYPPAFVALSRIAGLGPKTLLRLRSELGVENLEDLRAAISGKRIRELKGLGEKTEIKLADAIERMGLTTGKQARAPIAKAMPLAKRLVAALEALPEVERAQFCGSLRRMRETIADIDIVCATRNPASVMDQVATLPAVDSVLVHGDTKTSVMLRSGIQVDVRAVLPEHFGAAILYFTGSKNHNIKLRKLAIAKGWTLNEYSLAVQDTGEVVAAHTEQDIYKALDLAWIPPPMREDTGEVEAAAEDALIGSMTPQQLKGDLHVHTSLSGDGRSPLAEVLKHASARGYRYLAITDHGEDLALNGVGRQALLEQRAELAELQAAYPNMRLLHGCELNIGPEGSLDYDEQFRSEFDWLVAAVHSHFDLTRDKQTARVIRAMRDPSVNVIGHLTGRMIGKRPGIDLDIDKVFEAAVETNTAIEINSALPRLDAASEVLRRAQGTDVVFVMSTDAHHVSELDRMQWGVKQAERGWVPPDQVANTWGQKRFLTWAGVTT